MPTLRSDSGAEGVDAEDLGGGGFDAGDLSAENSGVDDSGAGEVARLVARAREDFPDLRFVSGHKFAFRPPRTIVIGAEEECSSLLLLHELGHAASGHREFKTDVARLKMEAEAWTAARGLAERYGVEWDEEVAQTELDSYRDWLHRKSRCPKCGLTRYQTPDGEYHCPQCENLG